MPIIIRELQVEEFPALEEFLYQAIFVAEGADPPEREIISSPDMQIYIENFGEKKGDFALVVEIEDKIVGCAWIRYICDYGYIDDETPSLAVSLLNGYRGKGIGSLLMMAFFKILKEKGIKRVSLSVSKDNKVARKLYQKLGFKVIQKNKEDEIMVAEL